MTRPGEGIEAVGLNGPAVDQVDVRGPRFAAWVTTAVLAAVVLVSSVSIPVAAAILAFQAAAFAIGAVRGPRKQPYGVLFAKLVALRLGPVTEREPLPPLRFAQLVGLIFAAAGLLGFATGHPMVGVIFTDLALFAAFLNAAFGICLGCMIYPLVARMRSASSSPSVNR